MTGMPPADHPLMGAMAHAEDVNAPMVTLIELTNACNVDCEHCYLDLVPDKKLGVLGTEAWKRVLRELAAEGCLFLILSGGELLMRRDWFEIASYSRDLGFALRLYTNGTLVDEKVAAQMAELRPLSVEISLLGATAETHDAVARKKRAFERTLRGIRLLKSAGLTVILKTVVMEKNLHEVDAMTALAASLGCEIYFDLEITPKNNGHRAPKDLSPEDAEMAALAHRLFGHLRPSTDPQHEAERLASSPCGAGRRTCHIGPKGDVYPCVQWTKPLGNLEESSFRSIWRGSDDLRRIRETTLGSLDVCNRCPLLSVCSPCMALSLLERGEFGGPSPTKCHSAEVRAAALGVAGRSAWLEEGGVARREAPAPRLLTLRTKDGRDLGAGTPVRPIARAG